MRKKPRVRNNSEKRAYYGRMENDRRAAGGGISVARRHTLTNTCNPVGRNVAERSAAAHLRGASQPRAESDGPQRPKLPPPSLPTLSYHPSPHAPYDFYGNIYPDALPTLHLRSRLHHSRPTLEKPSPTLPTSGAPPSLLTYLRIHLGGWICSSPPPSLPTLSYHPSPHAPYDFCLK